MMYANLRGPNGQVLGTVAIDPTAPGGMQGQLADAVGKLQQTGALPHAARPMQPGYVPPGAYHSQPRSGSMPFVCEMRFQAQVAGGGVQWMTRSIPCPPGLPPGVYIHTPGNSR